MATAYLLQSTSAPLKWKHTFTSRPLPQFAPNFLFESSKLSGNLIPKSTIKCFFSERKQLTNRLKSCLREEEVTPTPPNPIEDMIKKMLNLLKKPAIAAILLGILLMWYSSSAIAASGGRMGGSRFSSRSSSFSSSRSSSRGFSFRSRSRCSPQYTSLKTLYSAAFHEGSLLDRIPYFMELVIVSVIIALAASTMFGMALCLVLEILSLVLDEYNNFGFSLLTKNTSILKLQVGVSGTARSLQKDLNRIAEVADTSTRAGLIYVLTESSQALLRGSDFWISGYSSADVKRDDLQKRFNHLSIEERGKFDEETLVNVNNVRRKSTETQNTTTGFNNEYIVITILVAAEGEHKLPALQRSGDVKEALEKLVAIASNKIKAVEVLWTPQKDNDTLSEQELREDYPLLRPLQK